MDQSETPRVEPVRVVRGWLGELPSGRAS